MVERKRKPTLRYFARFKGDSGYLRAIIRYRKTRRYIQTPITITKEQLGRLFSTGHILHIQNTSDALLEGRLQNFTACVWQVVRPLIDSGEFASTDSKGLTTAIMGALKEAETEQQRIAGEKADADFQRRAAKAKEHGNTLERLTAREFADLIKQLKETMTPEEFNSLWHKADGEDEDNGQS